MKYINPQLVYSGVLFFLAIITGMFVTKAGRPLNPVLFNIHKLIALASLVLAIIAVKIITGGITIKTPAIATMVATAVFFLGIIATGGFLSFDKTTNDIVRTIHAILPVFTLISAALMVYLLKK